MEQHSFKISLMDCKMLTDSIVQLTFARSDGTAFSFIPGQFISLLLPDEQGKLVRRSYSIASDPTQGRVFEIAVSYFQGGLATNVLFNLKLGEELLAMGPFGRLLLREKDSPMRYVFVATGTGITPYRSMLPTIAKRLEASKNLKVAVLQGARYASDLIYKEDFLCLAQQYPKRFEYFACLSRETLGDVSYYNRGYVQSCFPLLALSPIDDLVYLCGNPNMVEQSMQRLQAIGFNSRNLRLEKHISVKLQSKTI